MTAKAAVVPEGAKGQKGPKTSLQKATAIEKILDTCTAEERRRVLTIVENSREPETATLLVGHGG